MVDFTAVCVAVVSVLLGYQHHLHETHGSPFVRASFGLAFIPFSQLLKYFYKYEEDHYGTQITKAIHKLSRKHGHLFMNIAMTLVIAEGNIY